MFTIEAPACNALAPKGLNQLAAGVYPPSVSLDAAIHNTLAWCVAVPATIAAPCNFTHNRFTDKLQNISTVYRLKLPATTNGGYTPNLSRHGG